MRSRPARQQHRAQRLEARGAGDRAVRLEERHLLGEVHLLDGLPEHDALDPPLRALVAARRRPTRTAARRTAAVAVLERLLDERRAPPACRAARAPAPRRGGRPGPCARRVSPSPGTVWCELQPAAERHHRRERLGLGRAQDPQHLRRVRLGEPVGHALQHAAEAAARGEIRQSRSGSAPAPRRGAPAAPRPTVASPASAGASSSDCTSWLTMAGSLSLATNPSSRAACAGGEPGRALRQHAASRAAPWRRSGNPGRSGSWGRAPRGCRGSRRGSAPRPASSNRSNSDVERRARARRGGTRPPRSRRPG